MSVFSYASPNLELFGAIIEVTIWPDFAIIKKLTDDAQKVPNKTIMGLIDTGASCTAIDKSIAEELHLVYRDRQPVLTPSGESEQYLYDIALTLPGQNIGISLQAFGSDLSKQHFGVLIGRDVLSSCTLVFNGWDNSYDLHFHQDKIKK